MEYTGSARPHFAVERRNSHRDVIVK